DDERLSAGGLDRLACAVQPLLRAADDRDVRSDAGERPTKANADPARASGDERRTPVEPEAAQLVHAPSFRLAASCTASTIFTYDPQRQRLPASPSLISSSVGCGFSSSSGTAVSTMPGVQ